jgi:hypothetical protein
MERLVIVLWLVHYWGGTCTEPAIVASCRASSWCATYLQLSACMQSFNEEVGENGNCEEELKAGMKRSKSICMWATSLAATVRNISSWNVNWIPELSVQYFNSPYVCGRRICNVSLGTHDVILIKARKLDVCLGRHLSMSCALVVVITWQKIPSSQHAWGLQHWLGHSSACIVMCMCAISYNIVRILQTFFVSSIEVPRH